MVAQVHFLHSSMGGSRSRPVHRFNECYRQLDCLPQRAREDSSLVPIVEWIVNLHENLLFGEDGRFVNGIGAICVILLSLTGAVIDRKSTRLNSSHLVIS